MAQQLSVDRGIRFLLSATSTNATIPSPGGEYIVDRHSAHPTQVSLPESVSVFQALSGPD